MGLEIKIKGHLMRAERGKMFTKQLQKTNLISVRDFFDDFIENFLGVDSTLKELEAFTECHPLQIPVPKYPKTNWAIMRDGTNVFEFAFTGIEEKDIKIQVDNNVLIVTSSPEDEKQIEGYYVIRDLAKRKASISIRLSDKSDVDKITASFKNGLLTVAVPLKESEKPIQKQIEIK
jgi:HSP20 family protein